MKLRSRDGRWTVEVVTTASGEWLVVREHGFYAGRVRSPEQLAVFGIDLADLVEVTELPLRL